MTRGPNSVYRYALAIDDASSGQRLEQAADLLQRCDGIVMLEDVVVIRATPNEIRCEVLDPTPSAHRCAEEFKVLVENAARRLAGSRLGSRLPRRPIRWLVVEVRGTEIVELWTAPAKVNPE